MFDSGGMRVGRDQAQQRKSAIEKANEWTAEQATRLGIEPREILDAVRRGWLSGIIQHLPASWVGEISGPPDCYDAYGKLREQIKTAQVLPIRNKAPAPYNWSQPLAHGNHHNKSQPSEPGETAMEAAFRQAAE